MLRLKVVTVLSEPLTCLLSYALMYRRFTYEPFSLACPHLSTLRKRLAYPSPLSCPHLSTLHNVFKLNDNLTLALFP